MLVSRPPDRRTGISNVSLDRRLDCVPDLMHEFDGILRRLGANCQNEAGGERILYKHAGNFARLQSLSQPTICKQTLSNPPMKVTLIAVFKALSFRTNYAM